MRFLFTLVLILAFGHAQAQAISTPRTVSPLEFRQVLAGWWDEGTQDEMGGMCGENRNLHRHVIADDGKSVTWEFERPMKTIDGKEAQSYTYQILESSGVALTLLLNGETRTNPKGEALVWELVVVDSGLFRWRATDFPAGVFNSIVGQRCR